MNELKYYIIINNHQTYFFGFLIEVNKEHSSKALVQMDEADDGTKSIPQMYLIRFDLMMILKFLIVTNILQMHSDM